MIPANQLRLCNIVQSTSSVWLVVISVSPGYIMYDRYDMAAVADTCDIEDLMPITLTPEVLEACGFVRGEASRVYKKEIAYTDSDYPCSLQYCFTDGVQICRSGIGAIYAKVFSLHELQNLYFSLTGNDLKIKELDQANTP